MQATQTATLRSMYSGTLTALKYNRWKGVTGPNKAWQPTNEITHLPGACCEATYVEAIGMTFLTDEVGDHWVRKGGPEGLPDAFLAKRVKKA